MRFPFLCSSLLALAVWGGLAGVASSNRVQAQARVWTSTAGTQIEAEHIATVGDEVWLREAGGRIVKVAPRLLVEADRALLPVAGAPGDEWGLLGSRRYHDPRNAPEVGEVVELLFNTVVPSYSVSKVPLEDALRLLSDAIAEQDPRGRRIEFRLAEGTPTHPVAMTTRKLSAIRMLRFICDTQQVELVARVVKGGVEIREAARRFAPSESPVSASGQTPVSSGGGGASARRCDAHAQAKNWLRAGDFELQASVWEASNQPKAFKRAPAAEWAGRPGAPTLGERVMLVTPLPPEQAQRDGPPYLVQTVKFPRRPKRVLLCADILNLGEATQVRFSASDPKVVYAHGSGNVFPFAQLTLREGAHWQHLEWQGDLSGLKNNELQFGIMFPARGGPWCLDNVTLRILED
jgi:hypothetical protein